MVVIVSFSWKRVRREANLKLSRLDTFQRPTVNPPTTKNNHQRLAPSANRQPRWPSASVPGLNENATASPFLCSGPSQIKILEISVSRTQILETCIPSEPSPECHGRTVVWTFGQCRGLWSSRSTPMILSAAVLHSANIPISASI